MKNIYITVVCLLLTSLMLTAQITGELSVITTTNETGGNFAPRNIVAIWIENNQGEFVKTLLAYAQTQKTHLNTWQASTLAVGEEFNTTDAITGATKTSHNTRTCTWDCTDYNGLVVPDGTYYVWMELTDKNSTGNYSSFSFTKDENPESQTPSNVPSFSSISIVWEPSGGVDILEVIENSISVVPNYSNGIYTVTGDNIKAIEVRNISGKLILKSKSQNIDISKQQAGIYLIIVDSDMSEENNRVIKKVYKH